MNRSSEQRPISGPTGSVGMGIRVTVTDRDNAAFRITGEYVEYFKRSAHIAIGASRLSGSGRGVSSPCITGDLEV